MNMKYMALFSLLFATGINSMSPIDRYENTRQEFRKCRNSWSSLIYGCDEQMTAFDKEKKRLMRPFDEIIGKSKDSDEILAKACYDNINFLDKSVREEYLKIENAHGLNSVRHHTASAIKEIINRDANSAGRIWIYSGISYRRDDWFGGRSSIEKQIIGEVKTIKEFEADCFYSNNRLRHIPHLLRQKNAAIINQVAEEITKEIDQLQTKNTI